MNAGHTRPTAFVLRCAPKTHEPVRIACFGARVLSMIRRPPSTIADRAIAIDLRRKRPDERVARLRVDRLHVEHAPLRGRWRRWADDHLTALGDLNPRVPAGLHDRAEDNWRPLLALADLAGGEWPARARAAAVGLSRGEEEAEESSIGLLRDVRSIFEARAMGNALPSADLTAALVAMPDRPWAECSGGRPMTAVKLAGRLKPFGLRTRKVREGARTVNAYVHSDFLDAWGRYLPANTEQSEQPYGYGDKTQVLNSEQNTDVPSQENVISSMFTESVPTVPTSEGENDEEDEWERTW
jgi:putative DNA primase/helicase